MWDVSVAASGPIASYTAVGKEGLAGDPPAVSRQELHDGDDILDFCKFPVHALRFVSAGRLYGCYLGLALSSALLCSVLRRIAR